MAGEECTEEKVTFWSRFVDLYYKTYGGSVSCCYTDGCNDASTPLFTRYPTPVLPSPSVTKFQPGLSTSIRDAASGGQDLNQISGFPQVIQDSGFPQVNRQRAGNCEKYFDKVNADEWVPDTLVPLAFDRASEAKVGVFYTKLGDRQSNNDHIIVRILDKNKQNLTMYSVKLFRVGAVSIHINKLEPPRNGGKFVQQDGRKTNANDVINMDKEGYQGFWISIKDDIEISIGKIGSTLIESVANFTDVLREGPENPYYFGLTTPSQTSASFGVNCDMPGLHFEDTCVTDDDCADFPQTVCRSMPVNNGLDPGTRALDFKNWKEGDELLKSCWCKAGHIRIPESKGCYDPVRKVVTLRDACFADYHCNDLPNTVCAYDLDMKRYNQSCQCLPGNKPFEPDPRTGLVEGCAPLTKQDKATINGCSRRFTITNRKEWVPEIVFPMQHDEFYDADVGVFFVTLGSMNSADNDAEDTAVIRLLDNMKDRRKMYTIKIFRNGGKIALYESKVTRSFFFSNENDKEVAKYEDPITLRKLEAGHVGFWVQYKFQEGYGGQLSVGLNGAPFSPDFALVKWTDTSTKAISSIKYMGFTTGAKDQSIAFGANCVLLKAEYTNPYVQVSPQQIQALQHQYLEPYQAGSSFSGSVLSQVQSLPPTNPWDYIQTQAQDPVEHHIRPSPHQTVIEPVINTKYLTKLKRLLPTYLEDLQDKQVALKMKQALLEEEAKEEARTV